MAKRTKRKVVVVIDKIEVGAFAHCLYEAETFGNSGVNPDIFFYMEGDNMYDVKRVKFCFCKDYLNARVLIAYLKKIGVKKVGLYSDERDNENSFVVIAS